MYKKAWCTCKIVVLVIKPIAFVVFPLLPSTSHLKVTVSVTGDGSQRRFLAQHSVATLIRDCFECLQHCSNIAALCCAKHRRCESSRVTSPQDPMPLTQTSLSFDEIYAQRNAGRSKTSLPSHFFSFPWFLALRHESLACHSRFTLTPVQKRSDWGVDRAYLYEVSQPA